MSQRIPGNERRKAAAGGAATWKWFRPDGSLERMPAAPAARRLVLERIVARFERDREYTEREVGDILWPLDRDVAMLRRCLVDEGLLRRSAGRYWRP